MISIGQDIASTGADRSVATIARIEGKSYHVLEIVDWKKDDTMESCGRIVQLYHRYRPDRIVIDADGIGAPVADRLREQKLPVIPFHGSARTDRRDMTGELGFFNMRSFAWWTARELLDPANGFDVRLPRNDTLIGDLCCPKWWVRSGGLIWIESKDDVRKRLKKSPDFGDSLVYCFLDLSASQYEENYRVMGSREVDRMIAAPPQSAPEMEVVNTSDLDPAKLDALLWHGAYRNIDIFNI